MPNDDSSHNVLHLFEHGHSAYYRQVEAEAGRLADVLAAIRDDYDDGRLTVTEAADNRIAALEEHLSRLQSYRSRFCGPESAGPLAEPGSLPGGAALAGPSLPEDFPPAALDAVGGIPDDGDGPELFPEPHSAGLQIEGPRAEADPEEERHRAEPEPDAATAAYLDELMSRRPPFTEARLRKLARLLPPAPPKFLPPVS